MIARFRVAFLVLGVLGLAVTGCRGTGSGGGSLLPGSSGNSAMSNSLPPPMTMGRRPSSSLGSVKPGPMKSTTIQPGSAMRALTPPNAQVAVSGTNWTVIPGGATQIVATAADPTGSCGLTTGHGTIWVLSTEPAGSDKYIWEGDGQGNWCNIPGLASQLAVAPDGTLYAVNAENSLYSWDGSSWTGLSGQAVAITVLADGTLYVLSNQNGSGDEPIWKYSGGTWTWIPGSGVAIVGSLDTNTYTVPGGTVAPGGFYVLTSQGYIYYGSADGGSYVGFSGLASAIAPVQVQDGAGSGGGIYALSYPADPVNGTALWYYDLDSPGWTNEAGAGVSLAADTIKSGTWTSTLYVVAPSSAIYASPITAAGNPHPASTGDTFSFSGPYAQNITYYYPAPTSSPFGIQTPPPYNANATVSQSIVVTNTPCPSPTGAGAGVVTYSCSGQVDFHDSETDAFGLYSLYPTTDAWFALSGSTWETFGNYVTDGNGNTYNTAYASPYVLDEVPETQGASWTNGPGEMYRETDANGSITEEQIASDGSYKITELVAAGYYLGITTSATGASTYAGGCETAIAASGCTGAFNPLGAMGNSRTQTGSYFNAWNGGYYGIVINAPSGGTIVVQTQRTPAPTGSPLPTPATIATPAAWYTPMPGNVLYAENDSIPALNATIPGACSVPAQFGTTANEVQQQIASIDPVLGYKAAETITTWNVAGFGPVCVQMSDVETGYYDWTSDTGRDSGSSPNSTWVKVFSPGASPAYVETISETLTLQSASGSDVQSAARRSGQARTQQSSSQPRTMSNVQSLTPVEVAVGRARFDAMVHHARAQRFRTFQHTVQRLMQAGGQQ